MKNEEREMKNTRMERLMAWKEGEGDFLPRKIICVTDVIYKLKLNSLKIFR
jgi:hypothetical protein